MRNLNQKLTDLYFLTTVFIFSSNTKSIALISSMCYAFNNAFLVLISLGLVM